MGRMKEIFMAQMEEKYQGDHDAMIQDMARVTCEELIPDMDNVCPNCFGKNKIHSSQKRGKIKGLYVQMDPNEI